MPLTAGGTTQARTIPVQGCQLITYPDSLGGDLVALDEVLAGPLAGLFPGGVHLLPPFPSSGDRGFAPITYFEIDPAFGTLADLERLSRHGPVMVDIMVNHISRSSEQFREFERLGRAASTADLFITLDQIWPDGDPDPADVAEIFLRKPEHPFSDVTVEADGSVERIWTSFGPRVDWSEQIDLDITAEATWELYEAWFRHLADNGVSQIRLDAIGYVVKRAGTSCFMVEPEIWEVLDRLTALAASIGVELLPEIHDTRPTFEAVTARGHTSYNFTLPGLVLDALLTGDGQHLVGELERCPADQVTMLDCHDGIPVQPDLVGALPEERMRDLVDRCVARGANLNRVLGAPAGAFDAHQINITYPDACGSDQAYLAARAIQLFAPGRPQIYYVGLLAGTGDHAAVERVGDGRAINRHDYDADEVVGVLGTDVVQRQLELIRLRNSHPAFAGAFAVDLRGHLLEMSWVDGGSTCTLQVDLATHAMSVAGTNPAVSHEGCAAAL